MFWIITFSYVCKSVGLLIINRMWDFTISVFVIFIVLLNSQVYYSHNENIKPKKTIILLGNKKKSIKKISMP